MTTDVFVVDDEEHIRAACRQALDLAGHTVEIFNSAEAVLDRVARERPLVLVTDVKLGGTSGLQLLARILDEDADLPVILITGHGDIPMAVEAMRTGAYDFIQKPFASEILVDAVTRAREKRLLVLENRSLRDRLDAEDRLERTIVGQSPPMVQLRKDIRSLAATDADVLVLGETGTGKELVSRALHDESPRADGPFVPINCGALPEALIESELFGHEAGAFTGARETRVGRIEHADGGTLLLDEIESMPLDLQAHLLRVLEDRKVIRLGANRESEVDIRVIAATKVNLRDAADTRRFREDLYYRLNVLTLVVPPLRARRDDILPLIMRFLEQNAVRFRRPVVDLERGQISALLAHDWPGNVRELKNAATRLAIGQEIEMAPALERGREPDGQGTLFEQMDRVERQILMSGLRRHGFRMKPTYEEFGISRKTLYEKMKKHGLEADSGQN